MMVRFTIITAFPDFFNSFLSTGIVGKGVEAGLVRVDVLDLRSFGKGEYRQIDDYAFGSGGMVLMAGPLDEALNHARGDEEKAEEKAFVVYPSPQGVLLTQEIVESLFHQPHVIIVCGRYEGIDERFVERETDLEITIGDCVLTGGEIPAMAIIDAAARLIPGVVGKEEAVIEDSFYRGMLDHPHYTRPSCWKGMTVPEVLLSGKSAEVLRWRRKQAALRTLSRRPDLLARSSLQSYMRGGFYLCFEYHAYEHGTEQIKELAGLCESYGVTRLLISVKSPEDRENLRQALGAGAVQNFPGFAEIKLIPSLNRALDWVKEKEKTAKLFLRRTVVDVCDEPREGGRHWLEIKRYLLETDACAVFCFLSKAEKNENPFKESADISVLPMLPFKGGPLSFCGKIAVLLDRFLGF
jgi:tRNA (guanine37-N1)-methyltransferase